MPEDRWKREKEKAALQMQQESHRSGLRKGRWELFKDLASLQMRWETHRVGIRGELLKQAMQEASLAKEWQTVEARQVALNRMKREMRILDRKRAKANQRASRLETYAQRCASVYHVDKLNHSSLALMFSRWRWFVREFGHEYVSKIKDIDVSECGYRSDYIRKTKAPLEFEPIPTNALQFIEWMKELRIAPRLGSKPYYVLIDIFEWIPEMAAVELKKLREDFQLLEAGEYQKWELRKLIG